MFTNLSTLNTLFVFKNHLSCREEAAAYILEPVEADSRRGLKRSWQGTPIDDGEEGTSSGARQKTPSTNKGMLSTWFNVEV